MITKTYCGRTDGPHSAHVWSVLPNLRACPGLAISSLPTWPQVPLDFRRQINRLSAKYHRATVVGAR